MHFPSRDSGYDPHKISPQKNADSTTSDHETRKTLLVRIRDLDDDHAWNEFAEIYTPLIYNYCLRRGLQQAVAADIVQEVMRALASAIKTPSSIPRTSRHRWARWAITRWTLSWRVAAWGWY